MTRVSRLLCMIVLALHIAAPVAAYAHAGGPAGPDFGALCSAQKPLSKAPAGAPLPHSTRDHQQHCAACGAPGVALPPAAAPMLAVIVATGACPVGDNQRAVAIASLRPRARDPPGIG